MAERKLWIKHSGLDGYVPNLSSLQTDPARLAAFRGYGALCAIFIIRTLQAPVQLSRWFILSLLDPSFKVPFRLLQKHEPTVASALEPWFSRPNGDVVRTPKASTAMTKLDVLIQYVFGKSVCSSHQSPSISRQLIGHQIDQLPCDSENDLAAIDRALLAHYLLDDRDFFIRPEYSAILDGWDLEKKIQPVSNVHIPRDASHAVISRLLLVWATISSPRSTGKRY